MDTAIEAWSAFPPDVPNTGFEVASVKFIVSEDYFQTVFPHLDPASHDDAQTVVQARNYFTADDDGLSQKWKGRAWLNPPYSQPQIEQFCEKLVAELDAGNVAAAITLTNNATDTKWAQLLLMRCRSACFYAGRIRFWAPERENAPPLQGQMLCYFGKEVAAFVRECGPFDVVLCRK